MIVSLFGGERDNRPQRIEGPWEQLAESLREYVPTACTLASCRRSECPHKRLRAWSPASWPPGALRKKATVDAVACLVIDLDHVPPAELDVVLGRFEAYDYVMHSSHSDSPSDRCVRVVVRLSRPVPGPEWPRFWRAAIDALGAPADERCKDPSRLYFLPSRPADAAIDAFDGSGFDYATSDGAPIDVDAILATAPPAAPERAREPVEIPEFQGAPDPDAYAAAVEALGTAWAPRGQRHVAQLALAGALTRVGWPVELVAQFCHDVAETAEPGTGDLEKRLAAARSSREKLEAGEAIVGWPTVEQYVDPDAVATATRALGMATAVPEEDPAFAEAFDGIAARRREAAGTPTRLELRTALERARDAGKRSGSVEQRLASKLLAKILKGEFLTEHADEDRERTLALAALAVVRALPSGTPRALIHELLLGPAGELACEVPEIVEDAIAHLARRPRIDAGDDNEDGDLPEPEGDEALKAQLILTDKGEVRNCGANIERILRYSRALKGNIRFNLLTKQIEVTAGRFANETVGGLPIGVKNWLSSHWRLITVTSEVAEQILRVAQTWCPYDPVAEYLRGLQWDRFRRVDRWLSTYCGVEDAPYTRKVGSRFLISAAARALDPGCKVDTVLVLEGMQGAKKSTTIGILGRPWFSDTPIQMGDKDSRLLAASKWIVELAELSSLAKGDVDAYKAFLSQRHDDFRPPYGRAPETFPRRCVFFGSVNRSDWLQDPTGNRRYWAVHTGRCDDEALERDRDQLWAEATFRYLSADFHPELAHRSCPGERWWFEMDEQLEADEVADERMVENPWAGLIQEWLERQMRPIGATPPRMQFTLLEIATEALNLSTVEVKRQAAKVAEAMRAAGMARLGKRPGLARVRLWQRQGTAIMTAPAVVAEPESPRDASIALN